MRFIYNLLRKRLLPYYLAEQNKPVTHKDLEYAFTDHEGKRYFRFPDALNLPLERYNKQAEYLQWMSARLTAENLTLLVDKALELIEKGIKQGKGASAVAAILYQIKSRQEKIIPHEIILNYMAVQYVREDENPVQFNNELHKQKVVAFKKDVELTNTFFLTLPEWRKFIKSTSISKEEWASYLEESLKENKILQESLKIYS